MINIEYFMRSDIGLIRKKNQDRILAGFASSKGFISETESEKGGCFQKLDFFGALVADGVGGSTDGGYAASRVQEKFKIFWEQVSRSKKVVREDFIKTTITLHQKLLKENNKKKENSASTLVLLHVTSTFVCLMNIGDSRGYFLRNGKWDQLTTDDIIEGTNQVSSAIGPENDVSPHFIKQPVQVGDFFLLCSDGLDGMVLPDKFFQEICSYPKEMPLSEIAEKLYQQAMEEGGRDNCSFVLLRILQIQEEAKTEDKMVKNTLEQKIQEVNNIEDSARANLISDQPSEALFRQLLEQNQIQLRKIIENGFLEQEEPLLALKTRLNRLETKLLYVLGIFGLAQLILLFVFLFIFKFF